MSKILITGGAGYIGSHMVLKSLEAKHDVVVLDNLSTGFKEAVLGGEFVQGDLKDKSFLDNLFKKHQFDAVMHFAASIEVEESVSRPAKYYENNFYNTLNLLNIMLAYNVMRFIFSSTAAIFGDPEYVPIDTQHPKHPLNPYGQSKLMVEQVLQDYDKAYGLKSIALRYFNAAGADPSGKLIERRKKPTHIIPIVLQAAQGIRQEVKIFGTDYDTPDGTCVRDYIHVNDLCDVHLLALNTLENLKQSTAYNLGNGKGFSVKEVIATAEEVTGEKIKTINAPRRAGDSPRLIADSSQAQKELGWQPKYPELKTIIEHAWHARD